VLREIVSSHFCNLASSVKADLIVSNEGERKKERERERERERQAAFPRAFGYPRAGSREEQTASFIADEREDRGRKEERERERERERHVLKVAA